MAGASTRQSLLLLTLVATAERCLAQINPAHVQNLTVYHLNPVTAGTLPLNMDTGDALGDLYFYLGEFLLPLECKNGSGSAFRAHFDCDNPERRDPNLVVTKVDMQIDGRMTSYSACNLCNGTDPFTGKSCEVGKYICDCFNHSSKQSCDATRIGNENIKDNFAPRISKPSCVAAMQKECGWANTSSLKCYGCMKWNEKKLKEASCDERDSQNFCPSQFGRCNATSPEWMCWAENIPRKTGGQWYSTLEQGQCSDSSDEASCGWKVLSTKTVKNTCMRDRIMTRVESASPGCFNACDKPSGGARDTNSSCWITCFYDVLLGEKARHSSSVPLSGLAISEVETAWKNAFLPEKEGGCPLQEIPLRWKHQDVAALIV